MNNKQVINPQTLTDLIGDDPVFIKKFKVDFLHQAKKSMQELAEQYQQNNAQKMKEAAHFLKTSAKAVGAEITAQLLQELEDSVIDNSKEKNKAQLILITNSIKSVYEVIINENKS